MIQIPEECCVRIIDLPAGVNGFCAQSEDGFANIYISARLNACAQRRVLEHELWHLSNDDLHSERSIQAVERDASRRGK